MRRSADPWRDGRVERETDGKGGEEKGRRGEEEKGGERRWTGKFCSRCRVEEGGKQVSRRCKSSKL